MLILEEHLVPEPSPSTRLSDYAVGIFQNLVSRKSIKKAIKKGCILIDGEVGTTGRIVCAGMLLQLIEAENTSSEPFEMDMPIVFEDDHLAVIRKPAGIPVSGNYYRTVQNALPSLLKSSPLVDALRIPRPVHRLDGPTAGLLLIGKTSSALVQLGRQFEERLVQKTYQAIVVGETDPEGSISIPIEDKKAESHFTRIQTIPSLKFGHLTLLELRPLSGRTHQLRIHLSQSGWPIVGDSQYSLPETPQHKKGLFLAATQLKFEHPFNGESFSFSIDAPGKFQSLLERENRRWLKYNS